MFRPVPPDADFAVLEEAELARWREHRVFERSVAQRQGAEPWVFYEGPPTANGKPGLHHVWARAYKDLFCRYRTMRGYYVARRAGWDTHGLPVEVEVEKRLGITGKRQIERDVGIAEFTRLCRESVLDYVDDWQHLTERIGYWVDLDAAYWTFDPSYVQSVWWHLKRLFDQGLLYEDLKVVPYCPRCGTALSSHELGQPGVYSDEEDESAYVLLPLVDPDPSVVGDATSLVIWTTTPWTLLSNTGVAVRPDLTYAVVDGQVVAEPLVGDVFGDGAVVTTRLSGADLVGLSYRRPFDDVAVPAGTDAWRVVPADFVTTEEGTGLVHLAPAFGEIDRQVGREHGLATLNPVGPDGTFTDAVGWLAGRGRARRTARSTTAWRRPGSWSAASPTSTRTRTAGGAGPRSSTGASPAGTSPPPPARTPWSRRTEGSTGTPRTSGRAGSANGWRTTSTGPSRGTASGGRRCPSGAAPTATSSASPHWRNSPHWPAATSARSTPTGRRSTRSPSSARTAPAWPQVPRPPARPWATSSPPWRSPWPAGSNR